MQILIITALGVGGATMLGAALGFLFGAVPKKYSDAVLGLAAGVMLASAMVGLILPAADSGPGGLVTAVTGVLCGALMIDGLDVLTPRLRGLAGLGTARGASGGNAEAERVLLFVLAVAVHNFPEGLAAGVSAGTHDPAEVLTVAGGIAIQNVPDGMVIIAPMLSVGISKRRTLICSAAGALTEVVGAFLGYFAVTLSLSLLPFAMALAGGTMLYVICDEMIPQTHANGSRRGATYAFIVGFCLMLVIDGIFS